MFRKIQKKHALSLIEVAIAMVLCAILLSVLFSSFVQSQKMEFKALSLQETALEQERVRLRLTRLFDKLSPLEGEKAPLFFTKGLPNAQGEALDFAASGILDTNVDFCHTTEYHLYLSKDGTLSLTSSFKQKKRTDILLTNIATLNFHFFNPKTKNWQVTWSKQDPLPSMMKIVWESKQGKKGACAFFLNPNPPIHYTQKE